MNRNSKTRKVIVVGAGGSGMVAAIAALQTEKNIEVLVLERNEAYGGITAIATGTIRACDTRFQKEAKVTGVTKQDAFQQYFDPNSGRQDPAMLDTYLKKSADAVEWLSALGCKISFETDFRHGIAPAKEGLRGGSGMIEVLYNTARSMGIEFICETKVTSLLTSDGKIAGVKAVKSDGKEYLFTADTVILCDGGFWGAGKGAFYKNIPASLKDLIISNEGYFYEGGSGDGARMAEEVGASLEDMDVFTYNCQQYTDGKGNMCPVSGSGSLWTDGAAVIVNQDVERFVNEDLGFSKEDLADEIVKELTKSREKWFWNIFDRQTKENAYRIREAISSGVIGQGFILTGDTVEELAQKMGVNADKLKLTISRYNTYFSQGLQRDPDYGRDLKRNKVHAIDTPPYFAVRAGIRVGNTRGGIAADKEARVLDKNHAPIPGLYVAGSSMDCVKFDGVKWLNGTGLTNCVVWGRIAGQSAALLRC